MFLRKKMVKGKCYWSLVESYRQGEQIKQRTIESLGRTDSAYRILKSKQIYSDYLDSLVEHLRSSPDENISINHLDARPLFQKVINGNSLELSRLIDFEIDTCITSPPYYAQRDYEVNPTYWPPVEYSPLPGMGAVNVEEWYGCLGLEPTLEMYIGHIVLIFREVWKVLKKEGTLWINFGDTYCSTAPNSYTTPLHIAALKEDAAKARAKYRPANPKGLKPKDLMGVPWRVAFALQADGWYLRRDIIWNKPNCLPESVQDRPTTAHEYLFLLSKNHAYYYDKDMISEPSITGDNSRPRGSKGVLKIQNSGRRIKSQNTKDLKMKNKRSVWNISTKPTKDAHFATFPPELVENCMLATCPNKGIVLDPFGGRCTVADVAKKYGRGFLCIELKEEYSKISTDRLAE